MHDRNLDFLEPDTYDFNSIDEGPSTPVILVLLFIVLVIPAIIFMMNEKRRDDLRIAEMERRSKSNRDEDDDDDWIDDEDDDEEWDDDECDEDDKFELEFAKQLLEEHPEDWQAKIPCPRCGAEMFVMITYRQGQPPFVFFSCETDCTFHMGW